MKRALLVVPLLVLAGVSTARAEFREINQSIYGMD